MKTHQTFATLEEACAYCGVMVPKRGGHGFIPTNVIGSHHGRGAGRVSFFDDGKGGYVKNWSGGLEAYFFYGYKLGERIPYSEWRKRKAEIDRLHQEEDEERKRIASFVSDMAAEILAAAKPAVGNPYLTRKRVERVQGAPCLEIDARTLQGIVDRYPPANDGDRQRFDFIGDRVLVIPLTVDTPKPVSLQLIPAKQQRKKRFLKGGRVKGAVWRPVDLPVASDEIRQIGLCEGVATALSVRSLFGVPCIAGMNAGNLAEAAAIVRTCYPKAHVCLYADRDKPQEGKPQEDKTVGIGEEKARTASQLISNSSLLVCPEFTLADRARFKNLTGGDNPTDFNDLMILKGVF